MRATARGPEALKLSKRSTCKTPDLPQHQARAALHSGLFTQAEIWGLQCRIMRAPARGPEALRLSKRSTYGTLGGPPQHLYNDLQTRALHGRKTA